MFLASMGSESSVSDQLHCHFARTTITSGPNNETSCSIRYFKWIHYLKIHLATLFSCWKIIKNLKESWRHSQRTHSEGSCGRCSVIRAANESWTNPVLWNCFIIHCLFLNHAVAELILKRTELHKGTSVLRERAGPRRPSLCISSPQPVFLAPFSCSCWASKIQEKKEPSE